MPMVKGALKRLDLIRTHPEFKENLWKIVRALQSLPRARIRHRRHAVARHARSMKGGVDEARNIVVDLRET